MLWKKRNRWNKNLYYICDEKNVIPSHEMNEYEGLSTRWVKTQDTRGKTIFLSLSFFFSFSPHSAFAMFLTYRTWPLLFSVKRRCDRVSQLLKIINFRIYATKFNTNVNFANKPPYMLIQQDEAWNERQKYIRIYLHILIQKKKALFRGFLMIRNSPLGASSCVYVFVLYVEIKKTEMETRESP